MSSESKAGVLAVGGCFLGLTTIAVGSRLYARNKQSAPFMADDGLAVAAWVTFVAYAIVLLLSVRDKTIGYANSDFTAEHLESMEKVSEQLALARQVLSILCYALIKLSALYFYRRIFCVDRSRQWFDLASKVTIIVVIVWLVVFEFLTGFECGAHIASLWDGNYTRDCTITFPMLYGFSISDFLLDIWILVLPIPRILQLHTTTKRKFGIMGVFLLGFVGLGASIARMVEYIVVETGGPTLYLYSDQGKDNTKATYFDALEMGITLMAVNIPTLWFLFTSISPEKVLRSILSVLSLVSLRSESMDGDDQRTEASVKAGSAATSQPSSRRSESSMKLRNDVEAQRTEVSAIPSSERRDQDDLEKGIHIHNTLEIHHHAKHLPEVA